MDRLKPITDVQHAPHLEQTVKPNQTRNNEQTSAPEQDPAWNGPQHGTNPNLGQNHDQEQHPKNKPEHVTNRRCTRQCNRRRCATDAPCQQPKTTCTPQTGNNNSKPPKQNRISKLKPPQTRSKRRQTPAMELAHAPEQISTFEPTPYRGAPPLKQTDHPKQTSNMGSNGPNS